MPHRAARLATASAWVVVVLLAASAGATTPSAAAGSVPTDLPAVVPPAATAPLASLPDADGWPFGDGFPRTSGTGRMVDGAVFWSDFLYDDNGPVSGPPANENPGAPSFGGYRYPAAVQANNGADIFRTAIGVTPTDTWWRVDWVTLLEPTVPIAAFGIDADADAGTGTAAWGANTFLRSAGLEHVLLVSGSGAYLLDAGASGGTSVDGLGGELFVDSEARAFVVRLPRTAFDPGPTSTVRLAAGLADAEGDGFLQLTPQHGWLPGLPTVYNVAFRDYDDEPSINNFWFDLTQAQTLSTGDISDFALDVDWTALADGVTEPEPQPTGATNRWYVSNLDQGQGILGSPETLRDDSANYLGRVQAYSVVVPTSYDPAVPTPLTWILHSYVGNQNQYLATAPSFLEAVCEGRGAICATTNGRGPDGFYLAEAELDFWEVWRDLAEVYTLDPDRTTLGGYSMGGFGTVLLAEDHPHLFAGMYLIAASPEGRYEALENVGHVPYYHAHGVQDALVPVPEALDSVARLDELGYRYTFDLYPGEDHVAWSLKDNFGDAAAWLASEDWTRETAPREIVYGFDPNAVLPDLGTGPRGAYWLPQVTAAQGATTARVEATSYALPGNEVEVARSTTYRPGGQPSPAQREVLAWEPGAPLAVEQRIELALESVGLVALDIVGSGLDTTAPGAVIELTTDVGSTLDLRGLPDDTQVFLDDGPMPQPSAMFLTAGEHRITFATAPAPAPAGPMPATGGGRAALALAVIGAGALLLRRRG